MRRWVGRHGMAATVGLAAATVAGAVLLAAGFVLAAAPLGYAVVPLLTVGLTVLLAAVALPVHWLPALSLVLFAAIPLQLVPSDGAANVVRPASILLVVWALRRWAIPHPLRTSTAPHPALARFGGRLAVYLLAGLLLTWMIVATARSTTVSTSIGWLASFSVGAFLPLVVFDARAEAAALRRVFLWIGGIFGVYAIVEQLLRSSPVYDTVYALVGASADAPWAVYRSEISFGHPLFAGAFLAIPAALGIGDWLTSGRRSSLVLGALAAVGVAMTVSRGSIVAVGVAGVFSVFAALLGRSGVRLPRTAGLAALGVLALVALNGFAPLEERQTSIESGLSSEVRAAAIDIALRAADASGWLGSGPGTSGISGRMVSDLIIENSLLQLLISIGVPGLLLFLALFAAAALESLRRNDIGAAAAIAAYLVALTGFNAIDAVRSLHPVFGFLLLLALNGPPAPLPSAGALLPAPAPLRARPVVLTAVGGAR